MNIPFGKPQEEVVAPTEAQTPVVEPVQETPVVEAAPIEQPVEDKAPTTPCPFCNGTGLLGQPHVPGNQVCANCLGTGVRQ